MTGQRGRIPGHAPEGSAPPSSSLPAALLPQLWDPGEDGDSQAGDARRWPGNNVAGKETARGGYTPSGDAQPPQTLAKSNLHHKTSELQKETKKKKGKKLKSEGVHT